MGRRRKHPLKITDVGARRLICGMIEQAVVDFKGLVATGRVVDGVALPCARKRRYSGNYAADSQIQELLDFFTNGTMDELLLLAGIPINPNLIREKLGISPPPYSVYSPQSAVRSRTRL